MKIAMLTTSAVNGGAAIVTSRLAHALGDLGHDVRLYTLDDHRRETSPAFLAERAEIFLRNGFDRSNLFKVSTARFGQYGIVKRVMAFAPDVILLGWINQGLLSLRQIAELGATGVPLVWVMHDMWCFTGICHHALGCLNYTGRCGNCHFIAPSMRGESDLSASVRKRKEKLYGSTRIKFVAVSRWLAERARRSSLPEIQNPEIIPNVFRLESFAIAPKEPGLIVMGAARLDDPIKGLDHAIAALNMLADSNHPTAHVAFFGELRNRTALDRLRLPHRTLGPLAPEEVASLMGRAEAVLCSSLYETLPTTLIEGQASGCVPVSFDRGGQEDIIDHMRSGFLAPFGDDEALARGLIWALDNNIDASTLRTEVERKFSARAVAQRYEALFRSLI